MSGGPRMRTATRVGIALAQAGWSWAEVGRQAGIAGARNYLSGKRTTPEKRRKLGYTARKLLGELPDDPWKVDVVGASALRSGGSVIPPEIPGPPAAPAIRESNPHPPSATPEVAEEEEPTMPMRGTLDYDQYSFFQLTDDPFDDIDPKDAWTCPYLDAVIRRVEDAVVKHRVLAVSGPVGWGKSTILNRVNERLDYDRKRTRWMTPGNLDRGSISVSSLTVTMLRDLGASHGVSTWGPERRGKELREQLDLLARQGEHLVLACDEAHSLTEEGFIALKRIWDGHTFHRSFAVLLFGLPSLGKELAANRNIRELANRTIQVSLRGLNVEESRDYLDFRFRRVGGSLDQLFEPAALELLLARMPEVTPMGLNNWAALAMQAAWAVGKPKVTAGIARRA